MSILLIPVSSSHAASYIFTPLNAPGSLETFVNGINDRGQIVRWYRTGPSATAQEASGLAAAGRLGTDDALSLKRLNILLRQP
jgi:hypothetical protein